MQNMRYDIRFFVIRWWIADVFLILYLVIGL